MAAKKNINLLFLDGPLGRTKGTISNWTGIGFNIPRSYVDICSDREELNNSGVYFLLGNDEDGNETFYVGQADSRKNKKGVLNRALEPHPEIDYWHTVVAITTKDNSLGGTKISYLENKFYNEAKKAERCIIKNRNEPSIGNPSEEEEAEMDEFIEYVKLLVRGFGYKFFEPISKPKQIKENILTYKFKGLVAYGMLHDDGFLLLKKSQLVDIKDAAPSLRDNVKKLREKHKEKIVNNVLQEDLLLNSPSQAASFCVLSPVSGNVAWIDASGNKLK